MVKFDSFGRRFELFCEGRKFFGKNFLCGGFLGVGGGLFWQSAPGGNVTGLLCDVLVGF